jgi:hypothetical protein
MSKPDTKDQRVIAQDQGIRVEGGILTEGFVQKGGRNPPAATAKPSAPPPQSGSQPSNSSGSQSGAQTTSGQSSGNSSGKSTEK